MPWADNTTGVSALLRTALASIVAPGLEPASFSIHLIAY